MSKEEALHFAELTRKNGELAVLLERALPQLQRHRRNMEFSTAADLITEAISVVRQLETDIEQAIGGKP